MNTRTIALAGATGHLGALIGDAVLDRPRTQLKLLVRPGERHRVAAFEARGAQVVEGGLDADHGRVLAALCDGASSVVCAVQGGPDVIIDGQARLLRAARAAGVGRVVPADFVANLFGIPPGRITPLDWRRDFAALADAERGPVEVVHVLNGGFLDRRVLFAPDIIDVRTATAFVWGDGRQLMDWTTCADVARYTAAVALDDAAVPPVFPVAGDVLDFHGIVRAYEAGSGRQLRVERLGSLDDLDAHIDQLQQGGPANFPTYFPLMCYRAMLNGEGKLEVLMNDRYPSIHPTTVREYVAREAI